jgi:fucose 4-O-acetylase-like acetyltransferase
MTERLAPIDVLKTMAILLVVVNHATNNEQENTFEVYLAQFSRYVVPMFFAVSGWLQATEEPIQWKKTRERLKRLLVPYFVASALVELYWWARGMPRSPGEILYEVAFTSAFGAYYFVFGLFTMILLAPLFARVPRRHLLAAWLVLIALRAGFVVFQILVPILPPEALFWGIRDPSWVATYYLAGWLASLYREPLASLCRQHRSRLLAAGVVLAGGLLVMATHHEMPLVSSLAGFGFTLVGGAVIALVSTAVTHTPRIVRWASDATYAIYLFHLFFVEEVLRRLPPSAVRDIAATCAGFVGPALVIFGMRRLLGERARLWVGA